MSPADELPGADLGALDACPDPGAREVRVGEGAWPLRLVLVRFEGKIHAYQNRCPHAGHPLNLRPDEFFGADGREIVCRSHGASFDPATGACTGGPCPGTVLRRWPVAVVDGRVRLLVSPEAG
jgi:nitrite reductase/ring-hydroxylating ferredoxin subunit